MACGSVASLAVLMLVETAPSRYTSVIAMPRMGPHGQNGTAVYLSSSLVLLAFARFLFGTGILHSIEKATQFVHGTLHSHVSGLTDRYELMLTRVMLHRSAPVVAPVSVCKMWN
jgi:hypothetical protein